jgi:hypothetical protein
MNRPIGQAVCLFILCAFLFWPSGCEAGGVSFRAQLIQLRERGHGEYRAVLDLYQGGKKPKRFVLHLRYRPDILGRRPAEFSQQSYARCITLLKRHATKRDFFRFGLLGSGFVPKRGAKGEYQSNALAVMEEYDGKRLIYSMGNPV